MSRKAWTGLALLLGGTSCIYTGDIGDPPPPPNNRPVFTSWLPSDTAVVLIGADGADFTVFFEDADEADEGQLELEWQLDTLEQGNGTRIHVWPEDLGEDRKGVLVATIRDPAGAKDVLIWNLKAE